MNTRTKQSGFSLIESLMTGILLAGISGIVLTFVKMHNNETGISAANFRLQMTANVVKEQVSRDIRMANRVLAPGETWARDMAELGPGRSTEVFLYDTTGAIFAGYRMDEGFLQEARPDPPVEDVTELVYENFSLGESYVSIGDDGYFTLSPTRQLAGLNVELTIDEIPEEHGLRITGTLFRCRN